MRDVAPSTGRPALDKPRARKEAAKVLAVALQTRYRKLLEASGEDETVIATADLAQCMYENIEFVIWALKSQGGMNPRPPEELRKITAPQPQPANDDRAQAFAREALKNTGRGILSSEEVARERETATVQRDPRFTKPPEIVLDEEKTLDLPCNCEPMLDLLIDRLKHATNCPKFVP